MILGSKGTVRHVEWSRGMLPKKRFGGGGGQMQL